MSEIFIRVWQKKEIKNIINSLFVIGEVDGECYNCRSFGIKVESKFCNNCNTKFKYLAFRRKVDGTVLKRFKEIHPELVFIDFNDLKRAISKTQAHSIFKD